MSTIEANTLKPISGSSTLTLGESGDTVSLGSGVTAGTGIGTTINNNADNRVITGSGTANTLEGEANLTYDGSTLTIKPSSNVHQLKLEQNNATDYWSLHADSSGGPLSFNRFTGGSESEKGSFTNNGLQLGDLNQPLGATSSAHGLSCSGNGYASVRIRRGADNGDAVAFFGSSSDSIPVGSISTTTSSTAYNTSSDYRLKENVSDISDGIDRVKQLQPKRFNFIADETDTLVDGFIAHEVSSVVPEAISGEKDAMKNEEYEVTPAVLDEDGNVITEAVMGTREVPEYQGIDQSKLVPLLVKTIQELEARITALETNQP